MLTQRVDSGQTVYLDVFDEIITGNKITDLIEAYPTVV